MTTSSPAPTRLGRVLNDARGRRDERLDKARLWSALTAYRTTSELSELSAIAARNNDVDTGQIRAVVAKQLSQ